ncbi:MAG TPA: MinD/ParA family protein [Desulfonatronum sp.]|mgnify:CR=1 FL=1|nr:MinD/ParA family protein [Desulfonatronum sp.]
MNQREPLVLSVTSGKGGVGKTNLSINLACALQGMGHRVLLLDADLGLANVDILLGLAPPYNIFHLLFDEKKLHDVLVSTDYGFSILPASSGVPEMLALSTGQKLDLIEALEPLETKLDMLIVDTGAGIGDTVLYFNIAVQERLLVITPEPTSLTDAYAIIKVLHNKHGVNRFKVIANMVADIKQGKQIYGRLAAACDRFLDGVSLDLAGCIPWDETVKRAVTRQTPFYHFSPNSPASLGVREIARSIGSWQETTKTDGNIKFFWKKLLFRH